MTETNGGCRSELSSKTQNNLRLQLGLRSTKGGPSMFAVNWIKHPSPHKWVRHTQEWAHKGLECDKTQRTPKPREETPNTSAVSLRLTVTMQVGRVFHGYTTGLLDFKTNHFIALSCAIKKSPWSCQMDKYWPSYGQNKSGKKFF